MNELVACVVVLDDAAESVRRYGWAETSENVVRRRPTELSTDILATGAI